PTPPLFPYTTLFRSAAAVGPRDPGADRVDLVRVDHRHWVDLHAGLQRNASHAGLATVEATIRRAGALRVHAQRVPLLQHPQRGLQSSFLGALVGAVDRHLPHRGEEPALDRADHPWGGEVFLL